MLLKINSVPVCKICKRKIYYLGKDVCNKPDCSKNFIKLDRVKVISPIKLGYHINNIKPFVTNKVIIIKPDLFRIDNLSQIGYSSSDDNHPDNFISEKIIDTFSYEKKNTLLNLSRNISFQRHNFTDWDELMMDISAYKGDLNQVKTLYLKGVKLTTCIFNYGLSSLNLDLIRWFYKKKCPCDKIYLSKNIHNLTKEIYDFLKSVGYIKVIEHINIKNNCSSILENQYQYQTYKNKLNEVNFNYYNQLESVIIQRNFHYGNYLENIANIQQLENFHRQGFLPITNYQIQTPLLEIFPNIYLPSYINY